LRAGLWNHWKHSASSDPLAVLTGNNKGRNGQEGVEASRGERGMVRTGG